ncbi:hypothetical protein AS593_04385 [Caulobacter vibrioides]|nr:hypothetical protein AS593_04385 [Caulobacter vibrioides]
MLIEAAAAAALLAPVPDAPIATQAPATAQDRVVPIPAQNAPSPGNVPPPAVTKAPAFKLINHDEDWSYLADPAKRTTPWSRLKYIPVGETSYLSLGGEFRLRLEDRGNERFGRGLQDEDGNVQTRARLWGDLHLGSRLRAFVDVQDARSIDLESGEPPIEVSRWDLHQAFLETNAEVGDAKVRLRVGRQELGLGAYRIFDMREGANSRTSFDMARVLVDRKTGWSGGAFFGYALREAKTSWDDATNFDYRLAGVNASRTLGQGPTAPKLELLYVNSDKRGATYDSVTGGRDRRGSYSARLAGRYGPWDYDLEGVYQDGTYRDLDVSAWYVSAMGGYTFKAPWSPRLGLRLEAASGDKDRGDGKLGSYAQMFPQPISLRTDFGITNLVAIQPQLTFKPAPKLTAGLQVAGLWRQSDEDGIYGLGGQVLRGGLEGAAHYVGWRQAAFASYAVSPFVTVTGIVNHTTSGTFLKQTGMADDQTYAGLIVGLRF